MKKVAKKKSVKRSPASRGPKAGGAPLRLEVGKTYVRRDGLLTRITRIERMFSDFPFIGVTAYVGGEFSRNELSYTEHGVFYGNTAPNDADLISEAPERRVMKKEAVDPGQGYRLLKEGEEIPKDAEWWGDLASRSEAAPKAKPSEWAIEHGKKMLPHLFPSKEEAYAWLEKSHAGAGAYWVREVKAW